MSRRVVVIGAGPMGLEAALLARELGHTVTVLEAGRVGESLLRWGRTRLFTPVRMNLSARARRVLGGDCPPEEALLTGPEMVERMLLPLANRPPLAGAVRTGCRVVSVGRARMTRLDRPGHPLRAERPFRVLFDGPRGEEALEAELVLDASGVYAQPCWLGAGSQPALGERALRGRLVQQLGPLEERCPAWGGKHVLLVGHGHSAANALIVLEELAARTPDTRVTWAVRTPNGRPCQEVAGDPLPERRRVVERANALAEAPPPFLQVERRAQVERLTAEGEQLRVDLSGGRSLLVEGIAAFTGYRPDVELLRELAVELSPVSEGSSGLYRALSCVTDCLSVPRLEARDLASGEPGFALIGVKSYGRMPTFLLQTGLEHIESLLGAPGKKGLL